jgi:hypothetical protein
MNKKPNYSEFSAWDDAKFTIGGLGVLLLPVAVLIFLAVLVF